LVDPEQVAALPDWPSREQALLALRDARLPFEATFIDIRAKLSGCPRIQTIHRDRDDSEPPLKVRWAGALLLQERDGGVAVAPLATIHPGRAEELSCPGVARFRREHPPGPLPGEAWTVVCDKGEPDATFGVLLGDGNEAIRWQTHLALTIAERCAMLLRSAQRAERAARQSRAARQEGTTS
jgi:hypothetical protein